jgi:hypothetical protein
MGDRVWTAIQFSGVITREVADALVEELNGQCNDASHGPEGRDFTIEHLKVPHNQFTDDECNYGTMEGIEALCQEHGISYLKIWADGGGFEAGQEIYNAVTGVIIECPGRDDYCLSLTELEKSLERGNTLEDVVGFLRGFKDFAKNYPALEIVE